MWTIWIYQNYRSHVWSTRVAIRMHDHLLAFLIYKQFVSGKISTNVLRFKTATVWLPRNQFYYIDFNIIVLRWSKLAQQIGKFARLFCDQLRNFMQMKIGKADKPVRRRKFASGSLICWPTFPKFIIVEIYMIYL